MNTVTPEAGFLRREIIYPSKQTLGWIEKGSSMSMNSVTPEASHKIMQWIEAQPEWSYIQKEPNSFVANTHSNTKWFKAAEAPTLNDLASKLPTPQEPCIPVSEVKDLLLDALQEVNAGHSPENPISVATAVRAFQSKLDAYNP
jgi:hypothetical protein